MNYPIDINFEDILIFPINITSDVALTITEKDVDISTRRHD